MTHDDIVVMCEELAVSGTVSLGKCSRTTAYSIAKRANFHLDDEKADWRARLDKDKETGCYTLTATCLYDGRDMNGEYAGGAGRP